MNFDWEQIRKEVETADPTIHFEAYWDPQYGEVILSRDKTRTAVKQWVVSTSVFNPATLSTYILDYWNKRRTIHPESFLTCACHAHVNPIAKSWHNPPVVEPKSAICPCGISRLDCDYHK
jgi:hypothetical protein